MKQIKAEEAIGKALAHDIFRYGLKANPILFKRGHVIRPEDVEKLKNSGDQFVYIVENGEIGVHENDAASRAARSLAGMGLSNTKPDCGRVILLAECPGILKVKANIVKQINLIDEFLLITRADGTGVRERQAVGMIKVVPLMVEEERIKKVEEILKKNKPVLWIDPPKIKKIAVVVTGTEVYERRVKDAFIPALGKKLGEYSLDIQESTILPDDKEKITKKILEFKQRGYELILVTGGMAVDATDVTPIAIKNTGAKIIAHGIPVCPGGMIMLAYLDHVSILGVPAGALSQELASLDPILPRILAGEKITKESLAGLGIGGFLL